ncbi:MAG: hypothetical protein M3177_07180, partial [Pseudomonadota bacterium]|nr:hypothetical protein [Pseudomonadota bacterium]
MLGLEPEIALGQRAQRRRLQQRRVMNIGSDPLCRRSHIVKRYRQCLFNGLLHVLPTNCKSPNRKRGAAFDRGRYRKETKTTRRQLIQSAQMFNDRNPGGQQDRMRWPG